MERKRGIGGRDKDGGEKKRRMEGSHSPSSEGEIDVHASFDDDFLNSPSARAGTAVRVTGYDSLFIGPSPNTQAMSSVPFQNQPVSTWPRTKRWRVSWLQRWIHSLWPRAASQSGSAVTGEATKRHLHESTGVGEKNANHPLLLLSVLVEAKQTLSRGVHCQGTVRGMGRGRGRDKRRGGGGRESTHRGDTNMRIGIENIMEEIGRERKRGEFLAEEGGAYHTLETTERETLGGARAEVPSRGGWMNETIETDSHDHHGDKTIPRELDQLTTVRNLVTEVQESRGRSGDKPWAGRCWKL